MSKLNKLVKDFEEINQNEALQLINMETIVRESIKLITEAEKK